MSGGQQCQGQALKKHAVAPLSAAGTPNLVPLTTAVADPLVFAAAAAPFAVAPPDNCESVAAKAFRFLVGPHQLELLDLCLCWHSDSDYHT